MVIWQLQMAGSFVQEPGKKKIGTKEFRGRGMKMTQ